MCQNAEFKSFIPGLLDLKKKKKRKDSRLPLKEMLAMKGFCLKKPKEKPNKPKSKPSKVK